MLFISLKPKNDLSPKKLIMKNFSAIMNRVQESFRYENDWEYDARVLYQIRSRVPHSISLSRTGQIMSEEQAVEELAKSVTAEEAAKKKEVYVLNKKTNELVLASITKSEDMKTFIVVPLEAKYE